MSSSVDQIKSKIDIVSLISSYIKLEKAGTNFKGKCPFHNEKTPSFFVSPDRGSYYCFGCQAKGDIFTFVQEFEGLDFIGALKVLAEKAGVALEKLDKIKKTEKDKLYSILEQATIFYQRKLTQNTEAQEYLKKRGIKPETIRDFRLGFSTSEWRELHDYFIEKGVLNEDMMEVGLIKRKDQSFASAGRAETGDMNSFYDTFRGRIMFPISDSSGRVVGFSGRILVPDEKSPKYLNSPETELFNKSDILFGLDKAKKDIRLRDYSILVEGQMDLVMMHQIGITNTVASSGTALTENHLIKLRRLSNRIIMAYDGDSAGFAASNRSSKLALSLGMELKVAVMPEGKDPADLAKDSPDKLKDSLKSSKHIIDFYVDSLLDKKLEGRELGEEIRKNVLPYVAILQSTIEQSHFIKNIAKKTFIKEEALWEDLKKANKGESVHSPPTKDNIPIGKRIDVIERRVMGIIIWQREKKEKTDGVNWQDIERRATDILGEKIIELEKELQKEKELLLFETESYYNNKTDLKRDLEELLIGLEEEYLKKQFSETMVKLQKAEQTKNSADVLRYLEECQKISQKINIIKKVYEKK